MQSGNQLNVVPDLFGGKRTGRLIAARDLRRQRAEGTAGARIDAVRFVQIIVNRELRNSNPARPFSRNLLGGNGNDALMSSRFSKLWNRPCFPPQK